MSELITLLIALFSACSNPQPASPPPDPEVNRQQEIADSTYDEYEIVDGWLRVYTLSAAGNIASEYNVAVDRIAAYTYEEPATLIGSVGCFRVSYELFCLEIDQARQLADTLYESVRLGVEP